MRHNLRYAMLATLALASAATIAGSQPADAFDYPYCLQGRETGLPGDCAYTSYGQCMAAASGRNAYCGINPRVAFRRPPPPRHGYRSYQPYPDYDAY
jgi:hypothetical protein